MYEVRPAAAATGTVLRQPRDRLRPHPPRRLGLAHPRLSTSTKPLNPSRTPTSPVQQQPVDIHVTAQEGAAARNSLWTLAISLTSRSAVALRRPARPRATIARVTADYLASSLAVWAIPPINLRTLTADINGEPFIPSSLLNRLRQSAVEQSDQPASTATGNGHPRPARHARYGPASVERQVRRRGRAAPQLASARSHAGTA